MGGGGCLALDAELASWRTPTATDGERGGTITPEMTGGSLTQQAPMAGWPTPMAGTPAQNGNNAAGNELTHNSRPLNEMAKLTGPARLTANGELRIGSDAQMESGGQLNPAHSRWLMGLPSVWDACGVTAMQSLPRKRRHS